MKGSLGRDQGANAKNDRYASPNSGPQNGWLWLLQACFHTLSDIRDVKLQIKAPPPSNEEQLLLFPLPHTLLRCREPGSSQPGASDGHQKNLEADKAETVG